MARVILSICAALTASLLLAAPATAQESAAATCDSMASSPDDLDLPAGAYGTPFADVIASDEAVEACITASGEQPNERRFLTHLGRLYAKRGEYARSIEAYRIAHGRGSAVAANNLGAMYQMGWGVPQNDLRATQYYRKAAHRGLTFAMRTMAIRAHEGFGMAANDELARFWFERASDGGDAIAAHDLGVMYRDGIGVRENDARALDLMLTALERDPDYSLAAYNIAWAYESGEGIDADLEKAREYYARAAENGDGDGADAVGRFYAEGLGVDLDPVKASEWYARGTALGSMSATVSLADAYQDGLGVPENASEARRLYQVALTMEPDEEWHAYIVERQSTLAAE